MNKVKYYNGDAVEVFLKTNKYQAFIHGANCQTTMNSGVAKVVKEKIPTLYDEDISYSRKVSSSSEKLGTISYIGLDSENVIVNNEPDKIAVNLYTQLFYGTEKRHFNYGAFTSSLGRAINIIQYNGCSDNNDNVNIVMPMVGCGLGGGDWNIVEEILLYLPTSKPVIFHVYVL